LQRLSYLREAPNQEKPTHQREGAQLQAKKRKDQSKQASKDKEQELQLYLSAPELHQQAYQPQKTN